MAAFYVLVVGGMAGVWLDLVHQHALIHQHDVRIVVLSSARLTAAPAIACSFKLVIVDIEDAAHALDLCRRLRALYRNALLLLVGDVDERYICDAYAAGVNECIAKPVDRWQLREKLAAWCERIRGE